MCDVRLACYRYLTTESWPLNRIPIRRRRLAKTFSNHLARITIRHFSSLDLFSANNGGKPILEMQIGEIEKISKFRKEFCIVQMYLYRASFSLQSPAQCYRAGKVVDELMNISRVHLAIHSRSYQRHSETDARSDTFEILPERYGVTRLPISLEYHVIHG